MLFPAFDLCYFRALSIGVSKRVHHDTVLHVADHFIKGLDQDDRQQTDYNKVKVFIENEYWCVCNPLGEHDSSDDRFNAAIGVMSIQP